MATNHDWSKLSAPLMWLVTAHYDQGYYGFQIKLTRDSCCDFVLQNTAYCHDSTRSVSVAIWKISNSNNALLFSYLVGSSKSRVDHVSIWHTVWCILRQSSHMFHLLVISEALFINEAHTYCQNSTQIVRHTLHGVYKADTVFIFYFWPAVEALSTR